MTIIHRYIGYKYFWLLFSVQLLLLFSLPTVAHHVLGRPAYSLNEDSNTPPSMAVETQVGNFFITYMVFPAFPKPGEPGRVNIYATRVDDGRTFQGEVSFSSYEDRLKNYFIKPEAEHLGVQLIDDGVYRQTFSFHKNGSYIIRASFEADGEPYLIDFPLRVGQASPIGTLGAAIGLLVLILLSANLLQRKRLTRAKTQNAVADMHRDRS
jgi:hypothetical protein